MLSQYRDNNAQEKKKESLWLDAGYKRGFVGCISCIATKQIMWLWAGQKISSIFGFFCNIA